MSEESSKGGLLLVLVTGLVIAVSGGWLWLARESGREQARYEVERGAVEELFDRISVEIETRAQAETRDRTAKGSGVGGGSSHREWSVSMKGGMGEPLLDIRARVALDGLFLKRNEGIRVETSGRPYDRTFVQRLSEELAMRGLRITSTSP